MKKVCYWCGEYMGEKDGNDEVEVFHSLCNECSHRLKLEERLPELLWGIAALRKQNGIREQYQTSGITAATR